MLNNHNIAIIKSTIPLLESAGPALTQHFYQRMFSHNPELKDIFNMTHQKRVVRVWRCLKPLRRTPRTSKTLPR